MRGRHSCECDHARVEASGQWRLTKQTSRVVRPLLLTPGPPDSEPVRRCRAMSGKMMMQGRLSDSRRRARREGRRLRHQTVRVCRRRRTCPQYRRYREGRNGGTRTDSGAAAGAFRSARARRAARWAEAELAQDLAVTNAAAATQQTQADQAIQPGQCCHAYALHDFPLSLCNPEWESTNVGSSTGPTRFLKESRFASRPNHAPGKLKGKWEYQRKKVLWGPLPGSPERHRLIWQGEHKST
jgi:hypothetical protein